MIVAYDQDTTHTIVLILILLLLSLTGICFPVISHKHNMECFHFL